MESLFDTTEETSTMTKRSNTAAPKLSTAVNKTIDVAAEVIDTSVDEFWENNQYPYQIYTLSDRAIPSAYDGLKPVQRRLLYQMYLSKLTPTANVQKSAKVCSAVSGNLHPHGDASVYGAASLMAAHYQRTRLINGKGSFPKIQGDVAASPRYTEMKLSPEGYELVRELSEHSVDMLPTFDGELQEPVVLPSRYPVLLVNGAVGIAEGFSTKCAAHNPREIIELCKFMIDNPNPEIEEIRKILPGPDWGTGGIVAGEGGLEEYLTTGIGKLTVRGKAHIENKEIVITELPPGLSSNGLQEKIRAGINDGKLPGISDMMNLTDRKNGLRIVVSIKRGHKPETVLESIYSVTPLEDTFGVSMVALDEDKVPRWWSVPQLITAFLELRDSVVLKRSEHRLEKASSRKHLVDGLIIIQVDIDKAISIIRNSKDVATAQPALMKHFEIDELQADYVLSMQLRRLTSQDALELEKEAKALEKEIKTLERLVKSPATRRKVIKSDLDAMEKLFSDPKFDRKTKLDFSIAPRTINPAGANEVSDKWKLNSTGVFGSTGELLSDGMGVAVFDTGKIKFTKGKGLPRFGKEVLVAPIVEGLVESLVVAEGNSLFVITRKGKILRINPFDTKINPQGIAGNGVNGIKIAEDDSIVKIFSGNDDTSMLSIADKSYKVLALSDVPAKGIPSQGVGFHTFAKGEESIIEIHTSETGFNVNGVNRTPVTRVKSSTKVVQPNWVRQ